MDKIRMVSVAAMLAVCSVSGRAAAQDIAAGYIHSCSIDAGVTRCWGSNRAGLLGDGSGVDERAAPVVSLTPQPLKSIDAGSFHMCGVGADQQAYCWGDNSDGVLGIGSLVDQPLPALVPGLTSVASVLLGGVHSCAIKLDGTMWCWGSNGYNQLGTDQQAPQLSPKLVPALPGGKVASGSAGYGHVCAVLENNTVRCWGMNVSGQLGSATALGQSTSQPLQPNGLSEPVKAVSAGAFHTCALAVSGQVYCWGSNDTGQLATGDTLDRTDAFEIAALPTATAIAAGGDHSCAIVAGGVQCWGGNRYGQLGTGDFLDRPHPTPIAVPGTVIAIQAGYEHTCARTQAGTVYCWGNNISGAVGNDTRADEAVPAPVLAFTGAVALAGNDGHQCAVVDGDIRRVVCAGDGSLGQLADASMQQHALPYSVIALSGIVGASVAVGSEHTCAVAEGKAWCWGDNGFGQLGRGDSTPDATPKPVLGNQGAVLSVVAGAHHTCALNAAGDVWCWGSNGVGEVGVDVGTPTKAPVHVIIGAPVKTLTAGANHTCALLTSGGVTCWGDNDSGQLGIGNNNGFSPKPVAVQGLSDVTAISAGALHTCARKSNGDIACWGRNDIGQLGPIDIGNPFVPNLVPNLPLMQSVASGGFFSCALTLDGQRWCWGDVPGNGSDFQITPPQLVLTPYLITSVSAGGAHVCDITGTGPSAQVHCTGDNARGQLGNGHAGAWATPQRVGRGAVFVDGFED